MEREPPHAEHHFTLYAANALTATTPAHACIVGPNNYKDTKP